MPSPVKAVAQVLPFQASSYIPAAIYLGRIDRTGIGAALGLQLFWIVALSALATVVWSRAQRRVLVQGG